jgi:hypothetical protein
MNADRIQIEIYKKMTPEEKWRVSMNLYYSAREFVAAAVRKSHPDWTPDQVHAEVSKRFLYSGR